MLASRSRASMHFLIHAHSTPSFPRRRLYSSFPRRRLYSSFPRRRQYSSFPRRRESRPHVPSPPLGGSVLSRLKAEGVRERGTIASTNHHLCSPEGHMIQRNVGEGHPVQRTQVPSPPLGGRFLALLKVEGARERWVTIPNKLASPN